MNTLREHVEENIRIKYNIDVRHETIHKAMGMLSENDWQLYKKCMKYPNYGSIIVNKCSGVLS